MHSALSLLDRLIDDAPDLSAEAPRSRAEELRLIREGFRRDLEALLNTRRICITPPAGFGALKTALPNYGVADFVGASLATAQQRNELALALGNAIGHFEPRLTAVNVTILKGRDPFERQIRIHIAAKVHIGQSAEPIDFALALDPAVRKFAVEDRADG